MAGSSRIDREHERLATEMNVLPVDENLYVKSLLKETYLVRLYLALLTAKITKQCDLILGLALLTARIAKQRNPILDLANITSKIAKK